MSFDQDPDGKYQRILMYHPESECIYEVFSNAERDKAILSDGMSYEVTGEEHYETLFRNSKQSK